MGRRLIEVAVSAGAALAGFGLAFVINPLLPL
jgi:hypothetical protein